MILDLEIKNASVSPQNWIVNVVEDKSLAVALLGKTSLNNKFNNIHSSSYSDFEEQYKHNIVTSGRINKPLVINKQYNTQFNANEIININFLRKERLYTKLKYSRSPAYDIVSGGAAAILAGFIGFLISEKFGFELVDSGDFYYLFIYVVFASFSVRPLLTTINSKDSLYTVFSVKPILNFFILLTTFMLKKLKV